MTDNEKIIKGLECIASEKDVFCKDCSYNKYYLTQCHKKNARDALELIDRQKAEIDNYIKVAEYQQNLTLKKSFEIKELKAEIERLKNECFCLANERDAYKDVLDTAVVEAVKEFAERLHEYINGIIERHEMPMFPFSVAFVSGMETKIDNLVKEKVGEAE